MPRTIHTTEDGEEITNLEFLVGLVEKTASTEVFQAEKSFTVRLSINLAASIDAMCQQSGQTRNLLCSELLQYAVDEVLGQLKPETSEQFIAIRDRLYLEYYEQVLQAKEGAK